MFEALIDQFEECERGVSRDVLFGLMNYAFSSGMKQSRRYFPVPCLEKVILDMEAFNAGRHES